MVRHEHPEAVSRQINFQPEIVTVAVLSFYSSDQCSRIARHVDVFSEWVGSGDNETISGEISAKAEARVSVRPTVCLAETLPLVSVPVESEDSIVTDNQDLAVEGKGG